MLVCDGANWQPLLSYNDDGEITMIGNQACGSGDVLTYNSAIWTCGAGGGGSGLFERSGTVIRPNSAAVTLSTDDFVFGSQSLDDVAGTDDDNRMFFNKSKGAFRAGKGGGHFFGDATLWNDENVGLYSMAWGYGANYRGANRATAQSSTAWGGGTAATGNYSTAWGGSGSENNNNNPTASGQASTAFGHSSLASGFASTAWGGGDVGVTTASGSRSTAWGFGSHAGSYLETSLGRYPLNTAGNATSWVATDTLFEIGNGTADNARSNAVTVYKNGRTELNIANDAGSCTSAKTGRLRYDDANDKWEYCNGSDPWRPFEQAGSAGLSGPADCPEIGEACDDDTIFAGWHPITHERLFIPPTDQGTTHQWKTSTGTNDIATDSTYDGAVNTNQVPNSSTFPAFKLCKDLGTGGHADWYLPSQVELYYLWSVHETIEAEGNITSFLNAGYWSSTEYNANEAWNQVFTNGYQRYNTKNSAYRVRCVRR